MEEHMHGMANGEESARHQSVGTTVYHTT